MEYTSPKLFSRHFLQYYKIRPSQVLNKVRLNSIIHKLKNSSMTHDEIAWDHCLTDSKGLNKFMNYHIGFSPSQIKELPEKELKTVMDNLT
ncbi:MAG: helix-turn-helix domain-containing protein [Candidatus Halalkalibacterium sp. M3_1C_030]